MYADTRYPINDQVVQRHEEAWQAIGAPGPFWSGAERVQMVAEARAATDCDLCRRRKDALSPFAVQGAHDTASDCPCR